MEKRQEVVVDSDLLQEEEDELVIPQVRFQRKYVLDVAIFAEQKFKGQLSVVPSVLVEYLNATELRVFLLILGHLRSHGTCITKRETISQALGVSLVTISNTMNALESMGFISVEQNGYRRSKSINFNSIQTLNDLMQNRLPGAVRAFRKVMGDLNVTRPTPKAMEILEKQFTPQDETELEEYD